MESPVGSLPSHPREFVSRTTLPADDSAASAARAFVRAVLTEWTDPAIPASPKITGRLVDDAVLLVSELVTNAVVHAGTTIEVICRLEAGHGPPASPPSTWTSLSGSSSRWRTATPPAWCAAGRTHGASGTAVDSRSSAHGPNRGA